MLSFAELLLQQSDLMQLRLRILKEIEFCVVSPGAVQQSTDVEKVRVHMSFLFVSISSFRKKWTQLLSISPSLSYVILLISM